MYDEEPQQAEDLQEDFTEKFIFSKEDFYNNDVIEVSLENDEISGVEEGFMLGYMEG